MHVYLWTTCRVNFPEISKFSLIAGSSALKMFFVILMANESRLDKFLGFLNNPHSHLKFVHEHFREKFNLIDIDVRVKQREFITDLYFKPTNGYQYL